MSLTFYYAPMTSAVRVHWALEELGVAYEKVRVDLASGEQRRPAYLALNPNGKVPLLVADGTPIFESLAIFLYLGETYGTPAGLYPPPGRARAEAQKWMCWSAVTVGEAVSRLLRNTLERFPAEARSPAAADAARKDLGELLAVLDGALAGKDYLLGNGFTLADVAVVGWLPFLTRIGVDLAPYANLAAWSGRCVSRPALARVMQG